MGWILILTLCTHANVCHKEEVPTEARMPMQCAQHAQQFGVDHPQYTITWFKCQPRENEA